MDRCYTSLIGVSTMPDRTLEQRMTEIEEGFANMQQEWLNIPDVIEARLRLTDSRVASGVQPPHPGPGTKQGRREGPDPATQPTAANRPSTGYCGSLKLGVEACPGVTKLLASASSSAVHL